MEEEQKGPVIVREAAGGEGGHVMSGRVTRMRFGITYEGKGKPEGCFKHRKDIIHVL